MIKPTIGRRIWYWPNEGEQQHSRDKAQAFDAGVNYVAGDTTVSITVTTHHGGSYFKADVVITPEPTPGCAQWMPYQKDQAAKPA